MYSRNSLAKHNGRVKYQFFAMVVKLISAGFFILILLLAVPINNSAAQESRQVPSVAASDQNPAAKDDDRVYDYLLSLSMAELARLPIQSSGLFPMARNQAPGSHYVVDTEQLQRMGIRSIAEYIDRQVPGMSTAIHGNQGTIIGVRGMLIDNNSKTIMLRDNININNRQILGINGSDLSTTLLGDIERVEISTGPGTLRYGSGAINGSINLISATGKSREGLRLHTMVGSGDFRQMEGSYGRVLSERLNYFIYGGYSKDDGVRPHYTLPISQWSKLNGVNGTPSTTFLDNVRVGKTDGDYKFAFRAQFGRPDDRLQVDLKGLLSHTSNVDPVLGEYLTSSASWREEIKETAEARGGRYSPFYVQESENILISPEIKLHINEHNDLTMIPYYHRLKAHSVFSDFLLDEVKRLHITLPPTNGNDCPAMKCNEDYYAYGDELHMGVTLINNYTGLRNQKIAWGIEDKYFKFYTYPWQWHTVSVFGEDQAQIGKFTLLGGLRYDKTYYNHRISAVPPFNDGPYPAPDDAAAYTKRLAFAYQISGRQTVRLSYQEGFRFADYWPLKWVAHQNKANGTNIKLKPETSKSYEFNYDITGLVKSLNITSALFYNRYKDTQGWVDNGFTYGNSPKIITAVGGELSLIYQPPDGPLSGSLSYSYSKPLDSFEDSIRVANQDDTWIRYPVHMFKMYFSYEIMPGLFAGANGLLESPRYEKAKVTDPAVAALFDKWSFVMDANLWYQFNKHLKFSFSAKELLHKNYNQYPAYFNGTRPLDSPRAENPQYYLSISYNY